MWYRAKFVMTYIDNEKKHDAIQYAIITYI